jgi:hypothetical protein
LSRKTLSFTFPTPALELYNPNADVQLCTHLDLISIGSWAKDTALLNAAHAKLRHFLVKEKYTLDQFMFGLRQAYMTVYVNDRFHLAKKIYLAHILSITNTIIDSPGPHDIGLTKLMLLNLELCHNYRMGLSFWSECWVPYRNARSLPL